MQMQEQAKSLEVHVVAVADPDASSRELLVFSLGGEEYGVAIHHVQELRGYEPPTSLANAPAYIKGVINLRGEIVPILDLRLRLNLGTPVYDQFTTVIILEFDSSKVGVVVDGVSDVVTLAREDIKPAPQMNNAFDGGFIEGVGILDKRMVILVDMHALACLEYDEIR